MLSVRVTWSGPVASMSLTFASQAAERPALLVVLEPGDDGIRGELVAVAELHAFAQVQRERQTVVRVRPVSGETGLGDAVRRALDERLVGDGHCTS